MCSSSQSVVSGLGRVSPLGLVFGDTKACSVGPKPFFKVPTEQIIFFHLFLLFFFLSPLIIMSNFENIDVNTIQWFDGEDNQHQNIPAGNTQLPNFSNSSLSPLILDMMNNPENQSRLQQRGASQIPPLDDIDILTYLMQADNENIIATHMNPMDPSSALMPGEIVPMPTISAQPASEPIEINTVQDHVAPSSNASDHSSPPAHSPPHHDTDEVDWRPDPETLKKMSSKERRQLRNKISARNFRVRRKEYISTLEEQIKVSDDRNKELQTKNRSLHEENSKLKAEIKRLREKYGETFSPAQSESDSETVPPITPPSSSHSVTEDNSSPPYTSTVTTATTASSVSPFDNSGFADMDFMDLYASADATPNTFASFISQAVMPNWDVSTVLQGKPGDGSLVLANRSYNPSALLQTYPLLGPALMSIVVNHTFSMNLAAFNTGNFPYNDPLPPYQANGVVVSDTKRKTSLSPGLDELTTNELGLLWDVLNRRYQTTLDDTDNPAQEEELRDLYAIGEKLMNQRRFRAARELFWNTLWKMKRLTPEEIEQKCQECTKCYSNRAVRDLQKQQQQQQAGTSSQQTRMTWSEKKQKIIAFKVRLLKSS